MKIAQIFENYNLNKIKPKNKTRINQTINFKTRQNFELSKYSPAFLNYIAKFQNNSQMLFGFSKDEIDKIDFQNIETKKLDNNLEVLIDSGNYKRVTFELNLKPVQKSDINNSHLKILEMMWFEKTYKLLKENEAQGGQDSDKTDIFIDLLAKRIEMHAYSKEAESLEALKSALDMIFNFDKEFTNKDFEEAKSLLLDTFDSQSSNLEEIFFDGEINKKDIENAKFKDIKKLHKKLISQSAGRFAIYMSLNNELKDEILNCLKNNVPNLKPQESVEDYSPIKHFENNIDVKLNSASESRRIYPLKDSATLKDEVVMELVNEIFNYNIENVLNSKNNPNSIPYEISCLFSSIDSKNKYIDMIIYDSKTEKKDENVSGYFDKLINYTKENKISLDEFKKLKNKLAKKTKERYEMQGERRNILLKTFSEGTNSLNDYLNTLKQINYDEIYQAIENYFNNPYIQAI